VIVSGSIASRAISGAAPFFPSLVDTAVVVITHWLLSLIARDSRALSALFKGQSNLLIKDGRVEQRELKRAYMSQDDLDEDVEKVTRHPSLLEDRSISLPKF
jgi:uncharacterized membrane protein YcaP (DUF421 family)